VEKRNGLEERILFVRVPFASSFHFVIQFVVDQGLPTILKLYSSNKVE
jgi:hypothetical protein